MPKYYSFDNPVVVYSYKGKIQITSISDTTIRVNPKNFVDLMEKENEDIIRKHQ